MRNHTHKYFGMNIHACMPAARQDPTTVHHYIPTCMNPILQPNLAHIILLWVIDCQSTYLTKLKRKKKFNPDQSI